MNQVPVQVGEGVGLLVGVPVEVGEDVPRVPVRVMPTVGVLVAGVELLAGVWLAVGEKRAGVSVGGGDVGFTDRLLEQPWLPNARTARKQSITPGMADRKPME